VSSGDLLTLIFRLCVWIDFRLRFVISSFVGSFTLLTFASFQKKKDFLPIGLMLCIPRFNCKPRKLIGQIKVKILSF